MVKHSINRKDEKFISRTYTIILHMIDPSNGVDADAVPIRKVFKRITIPYCMNDSFCIRPTCPLPRERRRFHEKTILHEQKLRCPDRKVRLSKDRLWDIRWQKHAEHKDSDTQETHTQRKPLMNTTVHEKEVNAIE